MLYHCSLFLFPVGMAAAAAEEIVKDGWLTKQGQVVKNWKRRWFVLTPTTLSYYASQEDVGRKPAKGSITLQGVRTVKRVAPTEQLAHCFIVSVPDRTFYLVADTQEDQQDWIRKVSKSLVQGSSVEDATYDAQPY